MSRTPLPENRNATAEHRGYLTKEGFAKLRDILPGASRLATAALDGLLSAAHYALLDGATADATPSRLMRRNAAGDVAAGVFAGALLGNANTATGLAAGGGDRIKLDGIQAGATVGYMRFVGETASTADVTRTALPSGWYTAWGATGTTPMEFQFTSNGPSERFLILAFMRALAQTAGSTFYLGFRLPGTAYDAEQLLFGGPLNLDNGGAGATSITGLAAGQHVIQLKFFHAAATQDIRLLTSRYLQLFRVA